MSVERTSDGPGQGRPLTALVTGANRGLGLETCRQLARLGLRVLLTSRGAEGAAAAAALAASGLPVEHRRLDVADPDSIARLARELEDEGTSVDLLVNNAGIALDGFDAQVAGRTLDVNFHGALRVTDALLPRVRDGGHLVMVSSGMGELSCVAAPLRDRFLAAGLTREGLVGLMESFVSDVAGGRHREAGWPTSAYRVSKVGLNALVRLLSRELAPRGIRVNAVCPGWVRTDMGGASASRTIEEGAASIVRTASPASGPTGGFHRDGQLIPW